MTFAEAVKTCFRKYATFTGIAARPEYWWFALFNTLVGAAISITRSSGLQTLWSLVVLLPGLAVAVRRLHDTGRSAWWLLTGIIFPWLIILLCLKGTVAGNPYAAGTTVLVSEADLTPGSSYCPTCGKLRLPGQTYCMGCGAKFDD
jgi:uncharacterized membrane protein YhaH (DUF805 family)